MKNTATIHETTRASPTIQKMLPAYSPAVERAMPTGRKPTAVTSVPVSMGNAVESQAKAAARMRLQPCSILTTIISTAMIASSTSRPSAMMREPSVIRSRLSPATFMTTKTTASTSGTDVATTRPERHPSEDEADDEHDGERLDERAQELAHRLLDDARLVRDLVDLDAGRNLRFGIRNRILELFTQLQNVGALGHGDDDTDGFAAVMAHDAAPAGPRSHA